MKEYLLVKYHDGTLAVVRRDVVEKTAINHPDYSVRSQIGLEELIREYYASYIASFLAIGEIFSDVTENKIAGELTQFLEGENLERLPGLSVLIEEPRNTDNNAGAKIRALEALRERALHWAEKTKKN
ncbi:MAG TPA: hypothetical protein ENJ77_01150 [Candidatus Moranbacteria bacterium]|nr:hypothetical protein [Candidatus Moranbacteria bacterium]